MALQTVSGQTITEPVTLAALKARLKLTSTADDAQLTGIITAAREFAERISSRCLAARQLIDYRDGFPFPNEPLMIPLPTLVSLDLIEYLTVDTNSVDTWVAWDASEYRVAGNNVPALVRPKSGFTYPCPEKAPGNVRVTFHAGPDSYGIPQSWLLSIEDVATFMYDNPGVPIDSALVTIPKIQYF